MKFLCNWSIPHDNWLPVLKPDFDTAWMHGREFPKQNKDIRLVPETAVYLGTQAS